ncbi:hypothetical protein ACFXPW_18280, partial [Streptomyces goshikiensis]
MPVVDISTSAEDFQADPYSFYARLRAAGPVHLIAAPSPEHEPSWLVVGHEEARAALNHPGLSKDWRNSDWFLSALATPANANMLESDPPQHTRLRRLVAREFTARRVEALRPPGGGGGPKPQLPGAGPPPRPPPHRGARA